MKNKIIKVFYGEDGYPYKDQARTVPFPLMGNSFIGSSNVTKIYFYFGEIGDETDSWVAVSKLPNGRIGSEILDVENDDELNEKYAVLSLSSYYCQYKGDVTISLQGYEGGVTMTYNQETGLYEVSGTPTIQACAPIQFSIYYSPYFVSSNQSQNVTMQQLLALIGTKYDSLLTALAGKLGMPVSSLRVDELPEEGTTGLFYVVHDDENDDTRYNIYIWNSTTREYIWVGSNELDLNKYYTQEQGEQFESDIDNRVTSVESELSSVASGSPKGVYATLAALQTAYPTGAEGIYVVQADGHWYYWNGSAWTSGGTYQSTGIAFGSADIPELKKSIGDNFESANMFDKSKIVDGHYFNSDGTIGSYADSQYCEQYIPVKYGKTYVFSHYVNIQYPIATYDKDGNFLARINHRNNQTITFNSNVAFIRLSIYNSSFNANFMFCEQGKVPTTYQDYKLWFNLDGVGKAVSDNFLDNESQNPIQNATITNKLFDTQENVLVTDLDGISEPYSGYGSDYGSGVAIVSNPGYVSYYFIATRNTEIYVKDTIASGHYYSICVGRNYTPPIEETSEYVLLRSSNPTRYRNTDNNLPTEDNKLTIYAGDVVVFSFTPNAIYHIVGLGKLFIPKKQASEYQYKKTTNELDIETPHAKYVFKLVQNQSIRIDTWRLYAGYLKKPDGSLFAMWSNTDAEGVVRIDGEEDFIGGYHGDETMTALKIFVDGVDITSETNKSGSFETISIYVNSDVYHCNTSSTPNVVAFKRSKQLNFNKDKWTVSNCFTAQENLTMTSCPMSLFQCGWKENDVEIASDYSVSPYYKNYTMEQATENIYPAANKDMTEFYLETKYAHIDVKVLHTNGSSNNVKGTIAHNFVSTQNRIKYYYYNIYNSGTPISQGESLVSQFEVEIK